MGLVQIRLTRTYVNANQDIPELTVMKVTLDFKISMNIVQLSQITPSLIYIRFSHLYNGILII